MGDRCATDDELNRARLNLKKLEDLTRIDHVRHADQLVAQVWVGVMKLLVWGNHTAWF